jgi:gliding motility-associated-like protein
MGNVSAWDWDFGLPQSSGSTLQNPGFVYLEAGSFDVQLIATHEDGCQDTVLKSDYINIGGPLADYRIEPDEICLGDSICLTAFTRAAVTLAVDFQDGTVVQQMGLSGVADTNTFCYLYTAVDTLSPTLIVTDSSGCSVFYRNKDTLLIHPRPMADLLPQDTSGCSPLLVNLHDASAPGDTSILSWLWDFGDGDSATDQNPSHTFVGDTAYQVTLTVVDGYGCSDTAQTTVTPQAGTIANFEAADTAGCAPFIGRFTDLSYNVEPNFWLWYFGDGDSLLGFQNPDHLYFNDGVYTVTLIVGDSLGCRDTLVKPDYIFLAKPTPIVYADQAVSCNPSTVTFFADSSSGPSPIQTYEWALINLDTGDTTVRSTQAPADSVAIQFDAPGEFRMVLTITDDEGCSGESGPLPISVQERSIPAPLALRNVSVVDRNSVALDYERYALDNFKAYAIYRVGPGVPVQVATITDQDSLQYLDSDPSLDCEANAYCYKVLVQNVCDEFSVLAETDAHCTIELDVTPQVNAIRLQWSSYQGYPVSEYEVYRVTDYDPSNALRLAVVPGNELSYLDEETFCRDSISYRVRAIGAEDSIQRSWSDLASEAPEYDQPRDRNDIVTATVVDDALIEVSWTEYLGYKPAYYLLERSDDAGATWQLLDTTALDVLSYTDTAVNVDAQSYHYRVTTVDSCGDRTTAGLIGKTMLLQASLGSGETPLLSWSAYEEWASDVLTYQIEVFNEETTVWEDVGLTSRRDRSYQDQETNFPQIEYCYRIRAREAGGRGAESLSNEDCLTFGPRIYVPNAFTPNGDGHNARFRIVAPNVSSGQLWIYNRWGRQVFYTDNIEEGWNGTMNERPVPEGVYVYRLVAMGFEGSAIERSGTVTLIR